MRTHTYWITYEEYLACGGIPRKPTYEITTLSYRRAPRMGVRRTSPYGGLLGASPYLISCSHQVHRLIICILII